LDFRAASNRRQAASASLTSFFSDVALTKTCSIPKYARFPDFTLTESNLSPKFPDLTRGPERGYSILGATPKVISSFTTCVTTEVTTAVASQVTSEVTFQGTAEVTFGVTIRTAMEVTPVVVMSVTPGVTPTVRSEVTLSVTIRNTSALMPHTALSAATLTFSLIKNKGVSLSAPLRSRPRKRQTEPL
jgi:hypothetical protein